MELIVVITILAILGTIGFISIQGYSSSARDSSRVSNLVNLHKGLTIYQVVSGLYPMPESTITITASGSIVGYQGFARDQVANVAKLSAGATKDPLDPSIYTTYSVNAAQVRMQLMAFLENGNGISAFIDAIPGTPSAYAGASSYSIRSPLDKGDSVGILLGTGTNLYQSVQELYVANSFTGVDIMNSTGTYTLYMSKSQQYSGTGTALRAGITGGGLIGYWNFDEGAGMTTYDKSGNGYHGTLSGTTLPVWTTGKVGKALDFGGSGGILFGTSPSTEADSKEPASLTLGVWVKFQ